jgi:hypothetical protein
VDSYSFEPQADAEVDAAAVVKLVNRVLDELSLVRYVTQLELNGGIFQSTRNSSLSASDGCGVTMHHFQVNS